MPTPFNPSRIFRRGPLPPFATPDPIPLPPPSLGDYGASDLSSSLTRQAPSGAISSNESLFKSGLDLAKEIFPEPQDLVTGAIAEEVTETALGKLLGNTVVKGLGIAALPLTAASLFELAAPSVQAWLKGGWKGASGVGRPLVPGEIASTRGGRATFYTIAYTTTYYVSETQQTVTTTVDRADILGPLTILRLPPEGFVAPADSSRKMLVVRGDGFITIDLTTPFGVVPGSSQLLITPKDGNISAEIPIRNPDSLSPVVLSPRPANSPYTPFGDLLSPFPSPSAGGSLSAPSPADGVLAPPQSGNLPSARPNPASSDLPDSITSPPATTYPTAPPNPPRPITSEDNCNPCQVLIVSRLDNLLDELKKKPDKEEEPENPNCPRYDFEFSIGKCEGAQYSLETITLVLAEPAPSGLREKLDKALILGAQSCSSDPVAAVPDYWQVKIGADRPQIVVVYRKGETDTYHSIAIPHPASTQKWTENLLGNYEKGPWAAMLTLSDNSKFTINCSTETEAERMLAKAKTLISQIYFQGNFYERISLRKGNRIEPALMRGKKASYFSSGNRKTVPDWTAKI